MSYSDRQITVIRDALAAYRLYAPAGNRRPMSWFELTSEINAHADIFLGKDLLRQFVEGVSKKNPAKRREPAHATLEVIVSYLTRPDVGALSVSELEDERAPAYQAPMLLLQYLKQDLDREMLSPPPSLSGRYQADCKMEDESSATVTVDLDCGAGGNLIAVTETLIRYHREDRVVHPKKDKPGGKNLSKNSRGWGILTPEDNILAFMKEEPYGYNHYYLSFAVPTDLWSESSVKNLVLLRHDYPLEFEGERISEGTSLSQALEYIGNNLLHFSRVS